MSTQVRSQQRMPWPAVASLGPVGLRPAGEFNVQWTWANWPPFTENSNIEASVACSPYATFTWTSPVASADR